MLLKSVLEFETKYFFPEQIEKISVTPKYQSDDVVDICFVIDGNVNEPVRTCDNHEDAEAVIQRMLVVIRELKDTDQIVNILDI